MTIACVAPVNPGHTYTLSGRERIKMDRFDGLQLKVLVPATSTYINQIYVFQISKLLAPGIIAHPNDFVMTVVTPGSSSARILSATGTIYIPLSYYTPKKCEIEIIITLNTKSKIALITTGNQQAIESSNFTNYDEYSITDAIISKKPGKCLDLFDVTNA